MIITTKLRTNYKMNTNIYLRFLCIILHNKKQIIFINCFYVIKTSFFIYRNKQIIRLLSCLLQQNVDIHYKDEIVNTKLFF